MEIYGILASLNQWVCFIYNARGEGSPFQFSYTINGQSAQQLPHMLQQKQTFRAFHLNLYYLHPTNPQVKNFC